MTDQSPAMNLASAHGSADRAVRGIFMAAAFISAVMLLFYLCVTYRVLMHSDAAVKVLLAEEMTRTGAFFPPDWYYINEIYVLFGSAVAAPLLSILAPGFAVHAIADIVMAVFALTGVFAALRLAKVNTVLVWMAMAVFLTGLSTYYAENVFGQSAYSTGVGVLGYSLATIFFLERRAFSLESRLSLAVILLLGLLLMFTIIGGMRGLLSYAIPLIATLSTCIVIDCCNGRALRDQKKVIWCICLLGAFCTAGFVGHLWLRTRVHLFIPDVQLNLIGPGALGEKAFLWLESWLHLVDALPAGERLFSIRGVFRSLRLVALVTILGVSLHLVFRVRRIESPVLRLAVIYFFWQFAIATYVYLFTNLSKNILTSRYFVLTLTAALVVVVVYAHQRLSTDRIATHLATAAASAVFLLSAPLHLLLPYWEQGQLAPSAAGGERRSSAFEGLAEFLKREGLTFGFASYWNAGVVGVFSDGHTRVIPVHLHPTELLQPFRHHASEDWFRPAFHSGSSFILYRIDELAAVDKSLLERVLGPPRRIVKHDPWIVYEYAYNVAERAPGMK